MIIIKRKYELALAALDEAKGLEPNLKNPPSNDEEEEFYRDYYEHYVEAIKEGRDFYVYCYDDEF